MVDRENPTSHSYFSQRLRLHYLDWGNDGAPDMLLVHGVHDHCHSWDWLAQPLRDRFHVVAPDLRGHGDSEWTRGSPYSYLEYVQDIAQLVRQQRSRPGHHRVALPRRYHRVDVRGHVHGVRRPPGDHRRAWASILRTAASPGVRLRQWIDANYSLAARVPRRYPSLEDAYHRMQETNPHLSPDQARHLTIHGSNLNEDGTYTWKFDNYTRTPRPYDVPNEDLVTLWQRIDCPVLIVNSRQGYPHRIGHDNTLRHFKNVTLREIDDAGHWTHHDQLDECVAVIEEFLRVPLA